MTNATIIKAVMSSAAEAELGALFLNAKEGVYLRQIHQNGPSGTTHTTPNQQHDGGRRNKQ
jgi:hypothetical protein